MSAASPGAHSAASMPDNDDNGDGPSSIRRRRSTKARESASAAARGAADMTRRMACGGIAGMIAKTATNPLDRIRMLSQTGEHGSSGKQSALGLYRSIIRNEGVLGLWAGNGANLLRVFPAKAVVFSTNDKYRQMLGYLAGQPVDGNARQVPGWISFTAGGMAGMSATAATYPLDLARGRITGKLAGPDKAKHYHGILNTVALTAREEGVRALYKGITPTLLGAMPYEGIKFGTVGLMEDLFPRQEGDGKQSQIWRKVCFGGMGGFMAGLLTYPNDTVRRMLQLQGSRGTTVVYDGYWDCVKKTYKKHGIQRFYHGVTVNLIRMAPNTAVQFGSYELLKKMTEGMV
mmetsp:Transcript_28880/g.59119  ORF Transcript_28880/g.59119 Transcript_28880/m.59119 type:complete len:346 (-) Transcript_28880:277-1314(-)